MSQLLIGQELIASGGVKVKAEEFLKGRLSPSTFRPAGAISAVNSLRSSRLV